jgi:hypothetical protein
MLMKIIVFWDLKHCRLMGCIKYQSCRWILLLPSSGWLKKRALEGDCSTILNMKATKFYAKIGTL